MEDFTDDEIQRLRCRFEAITDDASSRGFECKFGRRIFFYAKRILNDEEYFKNEMDPNKEFIVFITFERDIWHGTISKRIKKEMCVRDDNARLFIRALISGEYIESTPYESIIGGNFIQFHAPRDKKMPGSKIMRVDLNYGNGRQLYEMGLRLQKLQKDLSVLFEKQFEDACKELGI